jgi:DNA primase small subunit
MDFVKALIREYYSKCGDLAPKAIEKREFGFGDFERKIVYRHFSFRDWKSLKSYLTNNLPPFVSISSAHYQSPESRPMESKGWTGSELVFDLDANDLNLPCKAEHGGSWVCDRCLDAVKREAVKLIEDFLVPDFGFADSELLINFSGNRGYHIHVDNSAVFQLDSNARKSISNYIKGTNINIETLLPALGMRGAKLEGPRPTDYGWGGKIARGVINALNSGPADLAALGIDKKTASMLAKNRAEIILGITTGNWGKVSIPSKVQFWNGILNSIVVRQGDSIDRNVSTDINHLIRLPDTLHGDTGLAAKRIVSLSALQNFDPMIDAIAFKKGSARIGISSSPKLRIGNTNIGPCKETTAELETAAAAYLVLKRAAAVL